MLKYRRAVLKMSGEALAGEGLSIIDPELVKFLCEEVKEVLALGAELAIVVGGGNILRGVSAEKEGIDRVDKLPFITGPFPKKRPSFKGALSL